MIKMKIPLLKLLKIMDIDCIYSPLNAVNDNYNAFSVSNMYFTNNNKELLLDLSINDGYIYITCIDYNISTNDADMFAIKILSDDNNIYEMYYALNLIMHELYKIKSYDKMYDLLNGNKFDKYDIKLEPLDIKKINYDKLDINKISKFNLLKVETLFYDFLYNKENII